MQLLPKRENLYWTEHVRQKMRQYRLSESRIKRILRHPKRLEIGVAPDTVAGMQPAGSKKHPYETWVMWSLDKARDKQQVKKARFNLNKKIIIISAWRYPGVSPVHEPPPIPDDVWKDLLKSKIAKKRK
jgi:hypothetical protein